jgi:hypothetical protein
MSRKSKYVGLYEVGHKFGEWELLNSIPIRVARKPNSKGKNKHNLCYEVRCSCGKEQPTDCYNLEKGISTRCYDCSMKGTHGSNNPNWKGTSVISSSRFTRMKRQAKERGIEFLLEIQDFEDKLLDQNYICALTGMELTKETWSLDRIDSSKPYEVENIQWVHKDINIMKNKFEENYFIEMCKKVASSI